MPALLLRLLLQCAGDIEMNPGPTSTPTPANCLRLMQWSTNGMRGKVTELLTFLHSSNVNIAAIQETKLTNKSKPLRTPGGAAVRLDLHKNKGGGLLMLFKDTIPFVDNMAAFPQSADPHLEKKTFWLQCPITNSYPSTTSTLLHIAVAALVTTHLFSNNKMLLIVVDINVHHSRWDTVTNEDERGEQLADEIDPTDYTILSKNEATWLQQTTPFLARMKLRGYSRLHHS